MYFFLQTYSKKDVETQPIKGGTLQEIGDTNDQEHQNTTSGNTDGPQSM